MATLVSAAIRNGSDCGSQRIRLLVRHVSRRRAPGGRHDRTAHDVRRYPTRCSTCRSGTASSSPSCMPSCGPRRGHARRPASTDWWCSDWRRRPGRCASRSGTRSFDSVIDAIAGRVPLVVGVDGSTAVAIDRGWRAASAGAAGLMVLPPSGARTTAQLVDHYAALADVARVPILVQDSPQVTGVTLSIDALVAIADRHPLVRSLKVEIPGAGAKTSAAHARGHRDRGRLGWPGVPRQPRPRRHRVHARLRPRASVAGHRPPGSRRGAAGRRRPVPADRALPRHGGAVAGPAAARREAPPASFGHLHLRGAPRPGAHARSARGGHARRAPGPPGHGRRAGVRTGDADLRPAAGPA